MAPLLELRGITKRFPGVLANDHIDLTLEKGEIHALLGENGAGKTTLMNILYGLYSQDEGDIFVNGNKVTINEPTDAIKAGIGMVHQHFMLIPVFTVTENIMLGEEYVKAGGFLDRKKAAAKITEISDKYNLNVNPDAYVRDLPVGTQQRVEIIKILFREAEILIMDEPSAVLTPQEVDELFKIMRVLVDQGKSIIFITHKLREVMECADRITVIRGGKVIGSTTPKEADTKKLATMMVGRDVQLKIKKTKSDPKETVLNVENLRVMNSQQHLAVDDISFNVRAGEVLGIAGVQGNGQTELVRALTGLLPPTEGKIEILGQDTTQEKPRFITELGSAHIPEDRQKDGLILAFPVADNLILNTYFHEPFSKGITLQFDEIANSGNALVEKFDIRTPSVNTPVSNLSGGNQQKVIVAREFSRPIKLLIASQPTRGLDVGSIEYIHKRLMAKREEGCAILLVSTELDEIIQLSDRIAVMYRGKILDILDAQDATKEVLGLLMAGIKPSDEMKSQAKHEEQIILT
ncbi:MAG: Putative ABC transporter ATP-binding protein [Anaerolinea thermophila]|uniref:Putative ABC transporter ATP-binding protein n=1 Tax=Anaerolinea thermophila TaxID=167964 RepID=A0A101FYM3_9CHLR|nr:MAG: Putative ABC transporter ATP-binding protein [Anaerolinea thermophila]